MEETKSFAGSSVTTRLLKLPFQGVWFLVKHPIVAIVMILLIAFSTFSGLAHFNPAIAERFNNAAGYFGGAILLHESAEMIRKYKNRAATLEADLETKKSTIARKNRALQKAGLALRESSLALKGSAKTLDEKATIIQKKNAALKKASDDLGRAAQSIRARDTLISEHKSKLTTFSERGKNLELNTKKRFTKVALFDSTGEIIGWIPIVGDAVSIGLAAGGIYQMCQMFREIESATQELGAPYMIYTDTFCEKPAEKTKELVVSSAGHVKDSFTATVFILKDEAVDISDTTIIRIQAFLEGALAKLTSYVYE